MSNDNEEQFQNGNLKAKMGLESQKGLDPAHDIPL
jgi:hypothetical protein